MKPVYLALLLLIAGFSAKAQNLVTNGSFESYTTCPFDISQIAFTNGWNNFTNGTSDYFNTCAASTSDVSVPSNILGYQNPAHGNAYSGVATYLQSYNYREYITAAISQLTVGVRYSFSMSVSLADSCIYASDGLGAYFYKSSPPSYTNWECLLVTPQVSFNSVGAITNDTGWTRVSGEFTADSAYTNIIIGGFTPNASLNYFVAHPSAPMGNAAAYYYIDSVELKIANGIFINFTTNDLCAGDQITIPYTLNSGVAFSGSNIFTAQLSDATGNFTSPIAIGNITSNSAGSITATIPVSISSGTGYRIRIVSSSPVDSSLSNSIDIRITEPHTVTASSNAPICEGDTLFLNSTASITSATYFWLGPDGYYNSVQNDLIPTVTTAKTGQYIIYTSHNACNISDTLDVLINPDPSVTITNNNIVCPGTTFQLSATALAGSTFSWTGPGTFTSNIANPSWANAAYSDAGLYTVVASLNGCSDTADITMSVQITTATPVASSNSPVCEGFPLNLTALSATPGVTYNWSGPSGYTSTQQNPTQTSNTNHNGDFIVKATVNGCVSLPDTVHVQVLPIPYLGNYASPNDTVCEGTVVTFVTVPMSGVTNPTSQWFKNNIPVAGATNLTLVSPYATGDTFYCRTYCQNQCGDNLTLYSNKVGMTVMPIVTDLSVTLSSVPAPALPGNPVTFTATVLGGGYSPGYQWKKNGVAIINAIYAIYSADNLSPYDEIVCCVVSSDPCAVPTTACSDAMVINFPASVGEVGNDDIFQLYPNPNDGSFKVKIQKSKVKKIEVVNVSGQVVYQTKPETAQAEYTINLPSQLPSGTYMLRVYDGVQYYRQSFTVSK